MIPLNYSGSSCFFIVHKLKKFKGIMLDFMVYHVYNNKAKYII